MATVVYLKKDSFIASINNSSGSNAYRQIYALINGKKTDILRNGELSCAYFVSSLLYSYKLIKDVHATVSSTLGEIEKAQWKINKRPIIGNLLLWEAIRFPDGNMHKHLGFYLGKNLAISNHPKKKVPYIHHWTFGEKGTKDFRRVEKIFEIPFN